MRVYLDNSVIGRLLDIERGVKRGSKMLAEDMAILPDLLQFCVQKGIQLCVSDNAGAEIERLRSSMPELTDRLLARLRLFTLLPIRHAIRWGNGYHWNSGFTWAGETPSEVDLLAQELEAFLLTKTKIKRDSKREAVKWDAYHLAVCKDNGCQVFLTCDYASIWAYRRFLKRLFSIEVRRPIELLEQVSSSSLA